MSFAVHTSKSTLGKLLYLADAFGFRPTRKEWTAHIAYDKDPPACGWWDMWSRVELIDEELEQLASCLTRITDWMQSGPMTLPYPPPSTVRAWDLIQFGNDPLARGLVSCVSALLDLGPIRATGGSVISAGVASPPAIAPSIVSAEGNLSEVRPYARTLGFTWPVEALVQALQVADAAGFRPGSRRWQGLTDSFDQFRDHRGWWDAWSTAQPINAFESRVLVSAMVRARERISASGKIRPTDPPNRPYSWKALDEFAVSRPGAAAISGLHALASVGMFRLIPAGDFVHGAVYTSTYGDT